jgi:hypothetical protein
VDLQVIEVVDRQEPTVGLEEARIGQRSEGKDAQEEKQYEIQIELAQKLQQRDWSSFRM